MNSSDPKILLLMLFYLMTYAVALSISPKFREGSKRWFTLRDPIGLRFWKENTWFAVFSLCVFASAGLLILLG